MVENREWQQLKQDFKLARAAYVRSLGRRRAQPLQYPPDLATPFAKFNDWLNNHVRRLKGDGFPVSRELDCLHCAPSEHAWTFNAMWAFGCHYVCNSETGNSTVAFDSGIAAIPPSPNCTEIDVGILKNIILVTYHGINCVVMEGSWIKTHDQGRRVIRKDSYGFWVVQYMAREIRPKDNPYVYPASVSQVFFIEDAVDPSWKVVLRHDPRSKRIEGEREFIVFGASGSSRPTLSTRSGHASRSPRNDSTGNQEDIVELPGEALNAHILEEENLGDEAHLDDTQFKDEVDLQYVE